MKRVILAGIGCARRGDDDGCGERGGHAAPAGHAGEGAGSMRRPTTGPASTSASTAAAAGAARPGAACPARAASTPPAAWSAAPSATTTRWARRCSASKATSTGATSAAARPAGLAPRAAKPATTGSAPRAAASATPSIASCPTSPAVSPSATSRRRRPASRRARQTKAGWTLGGGVEVRHCRSVDRQGRISLRRSRQGQLPGRQLRGFDRRELPHQSGARAASTTASNPTRTTLAKSPGPRSGAFLSLELMPHGAASPWNRFRARRGVDRRNRGTAHSRPFHVIWK